MAVGVQRSVESMESGVWLIAKVCIKYILLPEFIAAIIFGGVLKVKGGLFKVIMFVVTALCAYLAYRFGLPELTEGL